MALSEKWKKSSFSGEGGNCVEMRFQPGSNGEAIEVRNSNRPDAGTIAFTRDEIAAWVKGAQAGEFDL